jgi:sugar lactone lactonase YvrE
MNYATSHMTIVKNPGTSQAQVIERRDPAYTHYMYKPTGIAMAGTHPEWGQLWATCGDNDSYGNYHMGPTLYSAELDIFGGNNPQTGLGSHLDMLHSTSFCRGIAWAGEGNQYFVFNSYSRAIDFYDFKQDHGPGNTDHSDGVVRRFWNNQVKGVNGVMSSVSFNADDKKLYVADTGNRRILALDPSLGRPVAPFPGSEDIAERRYFESPLAVLTTDTILEQPSGLEASGGLAFVTDAKTSQIHAFDLATGERVRSLDTGRPPGSLAGLNFGPDGKLYFVDRLASRVYRIDP